MRTRLVFAAALTLLAAIPATAQTSPDSLLAALDTATGADRLDVLVDLVGAFERRDPALSVRYGREALSLLHQYPDSGTEIETLYLKGRAHLWRSEFDSSMAHADRVEEVSRSTGSLRGLAQAANLGATAFSLQGNFTPALDLYADALGHWEALGDDPGIANTLNNLGIVHMRMGSYDESLDHYLRSIDVWERLGDEVGLARAFNNVGNLQLELGRVDEALSAYSRALEVRQRLGDSASVAIIVNNLGLIRARSDRPDGALDYFSRALAIWETLGDRSNIGRVLINMAEVHAREGDYRTVLDLGERALLIKEAVGDRRGMAIAHNVIGAAHEQLGDFDAAIGSIGQSLELAAEVGDRRLVREDHRILSDVYAARGDFREALESHRLYKAANDSLFNEESQSRIAELETRYESAEQRRRIQALERQQEVAELWRLVLIGGLFLAGLVVFLLFSRYRIKSRAHAELERAHEQLHTMQNQLVHAEKMASLGQLTAGIAHEIKNPLNFVTNFAETNAELLDELREELVQGGDRTVTDALSEIEPILADLGQNSAVIAQHGRRADGIVHAMMQHASGGSGKRSLTDVNTLVSEHIDLAYHGKKARVKDLEVTVKRDLDPTAGSAEMVASDIGRVLLNVLDNALDAVYERAKEAPSDDGYVPTVTVRTRRTRRSLEIRISDNGTGIDESVIGKIFEPFYTTKPTGSGTGLGLSLSFDIVSHGHGGTIDVERPNSGGTTFVVRLPVA